VRTHSVWQVLILGSSHLRAAATSALLSSRASATVESPGAPTSEGAAWATKAPPTRSPTP